MLLSDFDYTLPSQLIAQAPLEQRDASRLLYVSADALSDLQFSNIDAKINEGDVVVFNDTRVIKARLFGEKMTGGRVEALIERIIDTHTAVVHLYASSPPKVGSTLCFDKQWRAEILKREGKLFTLRFLTEESLTTLLERSGQLPLPPYITRAPNTEDAQRYQTVYAQHPGAIAAPTAGLHFTEALLARLSAKGAILRTLTLHVGAGTFQPVRVNDIAEHTMHSEAYELPFATRDAIVHAKARGKKIWAVGTTSLRALESAVVDGALIAKKGETQLFITPGFQFQVVDRLLTNFHFPKSTLLMLVAAFAGTKMIKKAYQHAIAQQYRFFSFGDACVLEKA